MVKHKCEGLLSAFITERDFSCVRHKSCTRAVDQGARIAEMVEGQKSLEPLCLVACLSKILAGRLSFFLSFSHGLLQWVDRSI